VAVRIAAASLLAAELALGTVFGGAIFLVCVALGLGALQRRFSVETYVPLHEGMVAAGFGDVRPAHYAVFRFLKPGGSRVAELAEEAIMPPPSPRRHGRTSDRCNPSQCSDSHASQGSALPNSR